MIPVEDVKTVWFRSRKCSSNFSRCAKRIALKYVLTSSLIASMRYVLIEVEMMTLALRDYELWGARRKMKRIQLRIEF